jgi:hypothetical protein
MGKLPKMRSLNLLTYKKMMIDVLENEHFDLRDAFAMLNTVFPPTPTELPYGRFTTKTLQKHRHNFFEYILAVNSNGAGALDRLKRLMGRDCWEKTRKSLTEYFNLADVMMKQASEIRSISFFQNYWGKPYNRQFETLDPPNFISHIRRLTREDIWDDPLYAELEFVDLPSEGSLTPRGSSYDLRVRNNGQLSESFNRTPPSRKQQNIQTRSRYFLTQQELKSPNGGQHRRQTKPQPASQPLPAVKFAFLDRPYSDTEDAAPKMSFKNRVIRKIKSAKNIRDKADKPSKTRKPKDTHGGPSQPVIKNKRSLRLWESKDSDGPGDQKSPPKQTSAHGKDGTVQSKFRQAADKSGGQFATVPCAKAGRQETDYDEVTTPPPRRRNGILKHLSSVANIGSKIKAGGNMRSGIRPAPLASQVSDDESEDEPLPSISDENEIYERLRLQLITEARTQKKKKAKETTMGQETPYLGLGPRVIPELLRIQKHQKFLKEVEHPRIVEIMELEKEAKAVRKEVPPPADKPPVKKRPALRILNSFSNTYSPEPDFDAFLALMETRMSSTSTKVWMKEEDEQASPLEPDFLDNFEDWIFHESANDYLPPQIVQPPPITRPRDVSLSINVSQSIQITSMPRPPVPCVEASLTAVAYSDNNSRSTGLRSRWGRSNQKPPPADPPLPESNFSGGYAATYPQGQSIGTCRPRPPIPTFNIGASPLAEVNNPVESPESTPTSESPSQTSTVTLTPKKSSRTLGLFNSGESKDSSAPIPLMPKQSMPTLRDAPLRSQASAQSMIAREPSLEAPPTLQSLLLENTPLPAPPTMQSLLPEAGPLPVPPNTQSLLPGDKTLRTRKPKRTFFGRKDGPSPAAGETPPEREGLTDIQQTTTDSTIPSLQSTTPTNGSSKMSIRKRMAKLGRAIGETFAGAYSPNPEESLIFQKAHRRAGFTVEDTDTPRAECFGLGIQASSPEFPIKHAESRESGMEHVESRESGIEHIESRESGTSEASTQTDESCLEEIQAIRYQY